MNVSSVKNLNGETFSAVQDADLTTVVQTNSGEWDRISVLSGYSADKWNILTNTTNTRVFAGTSSFSDLNYKAFLGVYRKNGFSNPDRYCVFGDAAIYLYNPDRAATVQRIRPDTIVQWNNYGSAKLDTSAFSSISSDWSDTISSYQNASSTYLTAHQSLDGYATTAWVDGQGYLTEVSIPESANWNETSTTVQTNSSNWNDISAYQNASGTYMPSGQFISAIGLDQFIRGRSTTANSIGFKIPDSTIDTPAVYLKGQFGSAYYKENELKLGRGGHTIAFNIGGGGPKISAGAYSTAPSYLYIYNTKQSATLSQSSILLSANDSTSGLVDIPSISAWNDTISSYQNASSTYLTAVDLSPYATTAEVDTLSSMLSGAIDYVSANAGGDVPTGTMNVSGLEYNAVNEISAYNGSAIAQYGAEKQWLQHDDTIVHVANSAQYAFGVNVSAVQTLMNVSEVSACMKTVNNTVTGNAGVMNRVVSNVAADIPDGWKFMCWCSFHTNGWVGAVDAGSPMASATDIWGIYAASNYSNTANCKINCVYLINKKLPGEA